MALVTTFATTPLTMALYPSWYQKKLEKWKMGLIDWETGTPLSDANDDASVTIAKLESAKIKALLIYLRLDNMPALLTFMSLLGGAQVDAPQVHPSRAKGDNHEHISHDPSKRAVEVHALRMLELTERDSSVMKVSEAEEYSYSDPILKAFCNFGRLCSLMVSGEIVVTPEASFAEVLIDRASREATDLLLLPWSDNDSMSETQRYTEAPPTRRGTTSYHAFITDAFEAATCNTGVLVDRGFGGQAPEYQPPPTLRRATSGMSLHSHRERRTVEHIVDRSHHIFVAYFGGADGRLAVRLGLQLAENPTTTVTIVHFTNTDMAVIKTEEASSSNEASAKTFELGSIAQRVTSRGITRQVSGSADKDTSYFHSIQNSLAPALEARVHLESVQTANPSEEAIARARVETGKVKNAGDLIILGRWYESDAKNQSGCLGVVADGMLEQSLKASVLVVRARNHDGN